MSGNDSLVIGYPPRGRKRQDSRRGDDDDAHARTAAKRLSREEKGCLGFLPLSPVGVGDDDAVESAERNHEREIR